MKNTAETSLVIRNEGVVKRFKRFMLSIFKNKKKRKSTIEYNPIRETPRLVERTSFNIIRNENSQIYEESKMENINIQKHEEQKYGQYHKERKLAKEIEDDKINFAEKTVEEIKEMLSQMGKYIEYLRTKIRKTEK